MYCRAEAVAETTTDDTEDKEEEGDDEEPSTFQEIDKLQNLGINVADIQKLKTGVCRSSLYHQTQC